MPISWVDGTPSASGGEPGIRFFTAESTRSCLIVLGGVQRVITHFVGKTVPCLGEECPYCRHDAKKLKCYLGALRSRIGKEGRTEWEKVLWQVNESNFNDLGETPFRGVWYETWKVQGSVARIILKRMDKPLAELLNDPPLDVKQILQNKWLMYTHGILADNAGGAA